MPRPVPLPVPLARRDDTDGIDELTRMLAAVERAADDAEGSGAGLRLREFARCFALAALDVDLLLVALAPEVDPRFERLYGYLHDDVTRRRPTVGLALELAGIPAASAEGRARLRPGRPLVDNALVEVIEGERPFLTRSLRIPDRVVAHLLGDDTPDPALKDLLVVPPPCLAGDPDALAAVLRAGATLVHLTEPRAGSAPALGAATLAALGLPALVVDLGRLAGRDPAVVARIARREARLRGAGLVVGPLDALGDRTGDQLAARVAAWCDRDWPVVLHGHGSWDPQWSDLVPLCAEAPRLRPDDVTLLWSTLLDAVPTALPDAGKAAAITNLSPEQVRRAATAARWHAVAADRPVTPEDVLLGTRSQNAAGLERLARRIEPGVGWDDIVLPPRPLLLLRELVSRARLRGRVLDGWGMRQGGGRGGGISALFAGPPGTGKTLAAEVVARELGYDLYTVDLATVVDKYIGQTEKNLERIFSEAEQVNGVLFFDEADALFGKRSDVRDAHDRYANVETAYLLQRMESFDGIAVLATNLRANLDDAFARRLDGLIDFPAPDVAHRRLIWERQLRASVPRADDVDLAVLAERFELSGGNIRNIALAASYFAAEEDRPVCQADLFRGTIREYLKLGRLCKEADFHPYHELLL